MTVFLGRLIDETRADKNAIRDERGGWTWRELEQQVARASNALRALGVPPGKRVAVVARNSKELVVAHVASRLAGVSLVPVNYHLKSNELSYVFRDSESVVVLADPSTLDAVESAAAHEGLTTVVWRAEPSSSSGGTRWEHLLDQADSTLSYEGGAVPRPVLYTSGTTGFPKGVMYPHRLFGSDVSVAEHLESLGSRALPRDDRLPPRRHLLHAPLYHVGGVTALSVVLQGVSLSILDHFEPQSLLATIERDVVTSTGCVPTHAIRLLRLPEDERRKFDLSSLENFSLGGAAAPIWVKDALLEWLGDIVSEGYGSTEAGMVCTITPQEAHQHPGSVGRPLPDTVVTIRDEAGAIVGTGTIGRVFIENSDGVSYLHGQADGHLAGDNTFAIGDLGYLDEDGYLYLTGRESELVVSGGVNIYPAEAERVLLAHPQVSDAVALGVPDEEFGEVLVAAIVSTDDSLTSDAVLEYCRDLLAHFKCPRRVVFVDELGRTAVGKVNKGELRRRLFG